MVSGCYPTISGNSLRRSRSQVAGRRRMVEQLPADTQRRCGGDIGRAVIDKERLRRIESVAAEQSPVDFRLGFHHALLAGDHLTVEKP